MTVTEKNAFRWRRAAATFQVLTIAWQWIIVFVFWGFCAAKFLPQVGFVWQFGLIWAHTWPYVAVLINFFMTDSRLRLRDFWHSWFLGSIYCYINYYYTSISSEPVYPFLGWESIPISLIKFACTTIFGTICLVFTGYIQECCMGRPFKESW